MLMRVGGEGRTTLCPTATKDYDCRWPKARPCQIASSADPCAGCNWSQQVTVSPSDAITWLNISRRVSVSSSKLSSSPGWSSMVPSFAVFSSIPRAWVRWLCCSCILCWPHSIWNLQLYMCRHPWNCQIDFAPSTMSTCFTFQVVAIESAVCSLCYRNTEDMV